MGKVQERPPFPPLNVHEFWYELAWIAGSTSSRRKGDRKALCADKSATDRMHTILVRSASRCSLKSARRPFPKIRGKVG